MSLGIRSARAFVAGGATLCAFVGVAMSSASASTSFTTAGTTSWVAPANVSSARFGLNGAVGGSSTAAQQGGSSVSEGGKGGATTATLSVSSGTAYTIDVGSAGGAPTGSANDHTAAAGGVPGGAAGGVVCVTGYCYRGGGGGGATIVRTGVLDDFPGWLLAAGGGGGGGPVFGGTGGNGGGLEGDDAASPTGTCGGQGGNQDGTEGSGTHLNGSPPQSMGAGGGGGWWGGAGGVECGAGGGSGFAGPAARSVSYPAPSSTGAGSVTIEWNTVTVSTSGSGSGTVTATGIHCGGGGPTDCTEGYSPDDSIQFTATPSPGSEFAGFSGLCLANPCTVTPFEATSLEAQFRAVPETTITKKPKGKVKKAKFEFTSSVDDSTFTCQVDDENAENCTSPTIYTGLAKGRHTFQVRATSPEVVGDPTPAKARFKIK